MNSASALGFDTGLLQSESFKKRWSVFLEGAERKFLVLFLEKRIAELDWQLEQAELENVSKIQGQIAEVRKLKAFLEQKDISNEIKSVAAFLS